MKYMLMMHAPRGKGDWQVFNWPPEDLKAHIGFMKRFGKERCGEPDDEHSRTELPHDQGRPPSQPQ